MSYPSPEIQSVYSTAPVVEGVLPLCRNAVGVFYSPSRLGHRTLVEGVLPLCSNAVGVFYSLNRLGQRTLIRGVLPLSRDAVGVFYSPSRVGHRTLVKGVLSLFRDAVGVFYSLSRQGHRTHIRGVLPLFRDAVGVFYCLSRMGYRTLIGGVLPLCSNAVGVFYSLSRQGQELSVQSTTPMYYIIILALVARISLTLARHSSLSFIALARSSGQHPVSSHSCCMYVRAGRPTFARPCVGVHKSTSLMSSSLLFQQCPACLVRLTWIVFVIGDRWPYSWCLVGCCRQDLFNIARSILV